MPIVFRQISAKYEPSTLCRLCATQSDPRSMTQIFIDSLDSLEIRISRVSPVQLRCGDGLPASVCKLCVAKLDVTTQFISKAIATYESLHKVLTFISKAPSLEKHEHGFTDKTLVLFEVMTGKCDLSSICRLCATQHEPFKMSKIFVGVCNPFEDKIRSVLHTKMSEGDGLPDSLCEECVSKLEAAHNFIMVSFASDYFLRNVLYKGIEVETVIKQETTFDSGDPVIEKSSEIGSSFEATRPTQGEQAPKTAAWEATMADSTPEESRNGEQAVKNTQRSRPERRRSRTRLLLLSRSLPGGDAVAAPPNRNPDRSRSRSTRWAPKAASHIPPPPPPLLTSMKSLRTQLQPDGWRARLPLASLPPPSFIWGAKPPPPHMLPPAWGYRLPQSMPPSSFGWEARPPPTHSRARPYQVPRPSLSVWGAYGPRPMPPPYATGNRWGTQQMMSTNPPRF